MPITRWFKKIWNILQFVFNAREVVTTIMVGAGVVSIMWGIFWTWLKDLEPVQIGLFSFGTLCFFIVFLNLFLSWRQKRNIERIPDMIEKLDKMTWD
jgi:hypothetical protein